MAKQAFQTFRLTDRISFTINCHLCTVWSITIHVPHGLTSYTSYRAANFLLDVLSIKLPVPDKCKMGLNRTGKSRVFWKTNIHGSNQHLCSDLYKKSHRQDQTLDLFAGARGKIKSLLQKMEKHILCSFPLFWFIKCFRYLNMLCLYSWTCSCIAAAVLKSIQLGFTNMHDNTINALCN